MLQHHHRSRWKKLILEKSSLMTMNGVQLPRWRHLVPQLLRLLWFLRSNRDRRQKNLTTQQTGERMILWIKGLYQRRSQWQRLKRFMFLKNHRRQLLLGMKSHSKSKLTFSAKTTTWTTSSQTLKKNSIETRIKKREIP
jgi:hypothetical protein